MKKNNIYFIAIYKNRAMDHTSISATHNGAIANFIEGTQAVWKDCYRYGWRIVKFEIIIKP